MWHREQSICSNNSQLQAEPIQGFQVVPLEFQMMTCTRIRYSYIQVGECDIINLCFKLIQSRKMDSYMTKGECERNEQCQARRTQSIGIRFRRCQLCWKIFRSNLQEQNNGLSVQVAEYYLL